MNLAAKFSSPQRRSRSSGAAIASSLLLAAQAHAQAPAQASAQAPAQAPTQAQTLADPSSGPAATVVAIVKVPKPWYAPRALVVSKMRDTLPQYAQLPGLRYKAFSFAREDGDFGGLYYWQDAASARAWFNAAWFERVRKERGVEGQVRFFDALISIDNTPGGTPQDIDSAAVGTLVEIAIPAGVGRDRLYAEFKAAVPTYQKVPGLLRKHFIVSEAGTFGGLYLWKDEASAKAWFNAAWHERVKTTYGTPAKIEWFDTPILLPTQRAENEAMDRALVVARP